MVSTVSSFDASAYLDQIKGITPVASNASSGSPSSDSTDSSSSTSSTNSGASTPADSVTLSSQLLSLLQQTNPAGSSGQSLSDLIGGTGDALSGLYNTLLYTQSTALPVQQAVAVQQQQQAEAATDNNPVQSILNSYHSAINAYNNTLLQNAASVLAANNGQLGSGNNIVS